MKLGRRVEVLSNTDITFCLKRAGWREDRVLQRQIGELGKSIPSPQCMEENKKKVLAEAERLKEEAKKQG